MIQFFVGGKLMGGLVQAVRNKVKTELSSMTNYMKRSHWS